MTFTSGSGKTWQISFAGANSGPLNGTSFTDVLAGTLTATCISGCTATAPLASPSPYTFDLIINQTQPSIGQKSFTADLTGRLSDSTIGGSDDLTITFNQPTTVTIDGVTYTIESAAETSTITFSSGGSPQMQYAYFDITEDPSPVSEPASLALFGSGLLGLAGFARRRLLE